MKPTNELSERENMLLEEIVRTIYEKGAELTMGEVGNVLCEMAEGFAIVLGIGKMEVKDAFVLAQEEQESEKTTE